MMQVLDNLNMVNEGVQIGITLIPIGGGGGATAFARVGRAGEEAVQAVEYIGARGYFRVGGRLRISDGMLPTRLTEIKNVLRLYFSRQLRDYLVYAQQTSREFVLWVRSGARLSGPLKQAVEDGEIILKEIP